MASLRAKKSGKNTRPASVTKQSAPHAAGSTEQTPVEPQLYSLSEGFMDSSDDAKPKEISVFTVKQPGTDGWGEHLSPGYSEPPMRLDQIPEPEIKPLPKQSPGAPRPGVFPHRQHDTGNVSAPRPGVFPSRPRDIREMSVPEPEVIPLRPREIRNPAAPRPATPDLSHTGSIPAYLATPPSRLSDAYRPRTAAATNASVAPVRQTAQRKHRSQRREETPSRPQRAPRHGADAPAQRKRPSPRGATAQRRPGPVSTPPAPSRKELNRKREDAEIRRRRQRRRDRAAMKPVLAYMDGTKKLDIADAKARPDYRERPVSREPYVPVRQGKGNTLAAAVKQEREQRRKQEERLTFLIVACAILFLVAGAFLVRILLSYRKTAAEYSGLQQDYVSVAPAPSAENEEEIQPEAYPALDINFASLFSLNNDLVGWIFVPGTDLSYPIVQTEDNDYYLTHTFLRTSAPGGAVFMDYQDRSDFSDFNTFIYGHNMQDGSMFGSLHEFHQDDTLAARAPYFYIYLANGTVRKYRICSYYRDSGDSQSYLRMQTQEEKEAYVQMILQKSAMTEDTPADASAFIAGADDSFVTLSTCQGRIGGGQRFIIHGYLVGVY